MSEDGKCLRLVINADDLGMSEAVNDAIFDLLERNRITSATILANGPAFEDAIARVHASGMTCFGVHLNLTELKPLTDDARLQPLLSPDGTFNGLVRDVPLDRPLRMAICAEWCAQAERLLAHGITPSHIDSHHHVHTMPTLFGALKRVQARYGIRRARASRNIYAADHPPMSGRMRAGKLAWNLALRTLYRTRTTAGFTSFGVFYQAVLSSRPLPHPSIELMTHPGAAEFSEETAQLQTDWVAHVPARVAKISYAAL